MPLYVTTLLQNNQTGMAAVTHAFQKDTNNLHHRQLLVQDDAHSGHYFMIVLNLRNKRFELINSLRTLGDPKLAECCNKVLSGIKFLWNINNGDSDYAIDDYELVDIAVPKQTNIHDCGFHMLLHAQYWDGRYVYTLNEKDVSNIRKIWTYNWLNYEENDAEWQSILNLT
ncbi:hypothetical protein PVAP13_6KG100200 [Panicum virgatum]|uniref:Ubiquitin-like protease family profile domain-containing protein n=1 Tax=Panicum virgatum TaxID=38727 RepID=A0A8T0RB20_PANVG|nr:hypothetical protein PVAP13_6KG100200 [Panicum virgatum]